MSYRKVDIVYNMSDGTHHYHTFNAGDAEVDFIEVDGVEYGRVGELKQALRDFGQVIALHGVDNWHEAIEFAKSRMEELGVDFYGGEEAH